MLSNVVQVGSKITPEDPTSKQPGHHLLTNTTQDSRQLQLWQSREESGKLSEKRTKRTSSPPWAKRGEAISVTWQGWETERGAPNNGLKISFSGPQILPKCPWSPENLGTWSGSECKDPTSSACSSTGSEINKLANYCQWELLSQETHPQVSGNIYIRFWFPEGVNYKGNPSMVLLPTDRIL